MQRPISTLIRLSDPLQRGFRRSRPGSVLILVVALLVLMSLIGVAYITSARVDRYSAKQNTFNTEVDLLLQALVQLTQRNITSAGGAPTDTPAGADDGHIWTSPSDSTWFGSRVPVLVAGNVPGWRYVAVSQTGAPFESPYSPTSSGVVQYTTRENLAPTSVTVVTSTGVLVYPAFYDASTRQTYLAASAAGDGVADAPLFRLPVGQLDGITYYGAARIIDNSSAVNASVADAPDNSRPGQYFPSNIDLLGMLTSSSAATQLAVLDAWRFNGDPSNAGTWANPVGDKRVDVNGNPLPTPTLPPYSFFSQYDALWSQLGRRLTNPGMNSGGMPYRALSTIDAMSLARRFSLANSMGAGSELETALNATLVSGVRSAPYDPDQIAQWFTNFTYENGGGNRRPLMTTHSAVSNIAASRFSNKGKYDPNADYTFGDWVLYPDASATGRSFVCILDINHTKQAVPPEGDAANSALCWAPQPWVQYPLKTPANTGTFPQLWLAYWGAMCETANAPASASANGMFRNPIRSAVTANGNPNAPSAGGTIQVTPTGGDDTASIQGAIVNSQPGDTLSFSGTYHISSMIDFFPGRTYSGGGGSTIAALTPDETLKLRAAIASVNTLQLRSNSNDILTKTFSMGGAVQVAPGGDGSATFVSNDGITGIHVGGGSGPTVFEGITFSGGKGILIEQADGLTIQHCTMQDSGRILAYSPTNTHIDNNTFKGTTPTPIAGYPGNNVSVSYNKIDLQNIVDAADWVHNASEEALHFVAHCDGLTVSHNNIIGRHVRWGIELQGGMTNLKVQSNYVKSETGPAVSCATGGDPTPPYGHQGENIDISSNILVCDQPRAVPSCGIEIMGDKNINIHDNYIGPFGTGILNGTGGQAGQGLKTSNNVIIADGYYADGDSTPWPVPPRNSSGDQCYHIGDPNAPAPPSVPTDADPTSVDPATSKALLSYRVNLYGSAPQLYITEVYANNDQSTNGGYIAVEMYNPYPTAISVHNWQLATIDRANVSDQLSVTQLSAGLEAALPAGQNGTILPHQRVIITNTTDSANPDGASLPTGISGTMAPSTDRSSPDAAPPVYAVIPELSKAFNQELLLLRPRRADGTLTQSTDPTNYYDEVNRLADLAPVDSYDFTGLQASAPADELSVEWHYIRPNDTNQGKAWHWVYPYMYTNTPTPVAGGPVQPRLIGTKSGYYDPATGTNISSVGHPDAAVTNPAYLDMPLEVNNTGLGAVLPKSAAQYPFGGFARNGDVLNTTYVGSYRIDLVSIDATSKQMQAQIVEINALTLDSAAADDLDARDNVAENIGRFAPLHPDDSAALYDDFGTDATKWSAYHFGTRLFDFVSLHAPHDDYMPNTDPAIVMNAYPVPNNNPAIPNATVPGSNEDNVGVEGLININTANWRVLAALPIATANHTAEEIAKAIVLYRDGDGTANNPVHGPFTSIFQLNAVPFFREVDPSQTAGFEVTADYQTQFQKLTQVSSLITTRSDTFTAYVTVQGWRGVGTKNPELVVQRRAAFFADRSSMSPKTPALITRNVPVN